MGFLETDRAVFVGVSDGFASVVVVGGTTSSGVLRIRDVQESEYGAMTRARVLQVIRGAFTTPTRDTTVTVGGVALKFRSLTNQSPQAGASSGFDYWLLA